MRQVENISPFDFFPAPYATDIQTADYVIERRRLTRNELLQLGSASGYDVDVIAEVFEANPNGAPLPYGSVDDDDISDTAGAVSYTHLTLPTIYSVYTPVVAVSLKKKTNHTTTFLHNPPTSRTPYFPTFCSSPSSLFY